MLRHLRLEYIYRNADITAEHLLVWAVKELPTSKDF